MISAVLGVRSEYRIGKRQVPPARTFHSSGVPKHEQINNVRYPECDSSEESGEVAS